MGFNNEKKILGLCFKRKVTSNFCNAEKEIHFVFVGPNTVLKVSHMSNTLNLSRVVFARGRIESDRDRNRKWVQGA